MLTLSVLDQSPIAEGSSGADALHRSVDLARRADQLGYRRYWVAEHHGAASLACAAPEVLIGAVAGATSRMRVGSGGVMLPHYSPLKVAEVFSMLAALHPGRIDLGLGRAAGTDGLTAFALQRNRQHGAPDDFPDQLRELLAYLNDAFPEGHRFARLAQLPGRPACAVPWLLGSSPDSAGWAADLGLPYAFADFINPGQGHIAHHYRTTFQPSASQPAPYVMVAAWVICADTDEEAQRLAASSRMTFALLQQGRLIPVPPVETALRYLEAHAGERNPFARTRRAIVGAPATVIPKLQTLAEEYGADEVMVVTITYDHAARCRSYDLLAAALG